MNLVKKGRLLRSRKAALVVLLLTCATGICFFGWRAVSAQRPKDDITTQAAINIDLGATGVVTSTVIGATNESHLSGNESPGTTTEPARARAIAIGDFNDDGLPDVAIGAPDTDFTIGATTRNGAVYIIFGRTAAFPEFFDTNPASIALQPNVRIVGTDAQTGSTAEANAGFALAAGDVNGDGNDDLLIGAPGADFPGSATVPPVPARNDTGAVHIILGSNALVNGATIDLGAPPPTIPVTTIFGVAAGERFGSAIAVSNVGGPAGAPPEQVAVRDIVVGAPGSTGPTGGTARPGAGAVYLLYGGSGLTPATGSTTRVIDLASAATPPNAIIFGAAGDALGSALGIGNPNAGTDDDLIVGAPGADRPALTGGPAALADTGATYIFFGGANLNPGAGGGTTKVFDITSTSAGLRPGISIYGADTGDQMGATVASDDVTGDGTDDLVIGAPGGDGRTGAVRADSGEAYVIPGRPDLNPPSGASELRIDVSGGGGGFIRPTIFGAAAGDRAGSTVAIGRFNIDDNQDQIPDLFVSSPFANSSEGFVSMFFGGTMLTAFAELDLVSSGQDNVRFLGQAAGDELGWALATADLNNDRGSDIILGAPFADNSARTNNGEVYIVLAEAEDIPPPPNQPPTVRVLTPNGGGTVQGGANFTITWEADDPNGDETIAGFDIFLSLNGGTSFNTIIATGVSGAARSFVWAVPTGLNTTTARVRVRVTDDRGATAQDDSDSNFAITDVGVTVTLTSPNGGESFKFGQMVQIQWTVPVAQEAQVEGFDLFYSTDGGVTFPGIIAFDPLNPALSAGVRTFDWTVPNVCISQGRVLVVATSLTGAQSQDTSNANFSVTAEGPTIDVNRMRMNENGNKLKLRTTQPPVGNEITFAQGVRVEISADAAGTQFFPFSVVNVSSNSRKLGAKGQINGMDLEDFFPDMAIRILRVTNPECGVREIRVQRNGRSLVQVTTAAAPSYTAMP